MRRATTFAIGASAVIALTAAVISSSRAIGQREGELAAPEDGHWNRVNVLAAAGATPIQCPGCWFPRTQSENFDTLTPPELPPGWLATNAVGPPPLWVTSNSGVPMPPADTAPNALFIDDPAVVSDKRLDGWFLDFFEDCCVQLTFRLTSISKLLIQILIWASTVAYWSSALMMEIRFKTS